MSRKIGTRTDITSINALAELERVGWKWKPLNETEVRISCPVHEDATPSAALNTDSRLWRCHATQCGAAGDIVTLLAHILKVQRETVLVDLSSRYDVDEGRHIPPSQVEKFAALISTAGPLLDALRKRGVTDEMIAKARIGFWDGRITIPVFDEHGRCTNVRRYLPGAPGHLKMFNTRGYGKPAIYQVDQLLKHRRVWLCGGEMKALVAGHLLATLPDLDCGAIAVTAGEGVWDSGWDKLIAGKEIYVCMDVDKAGRKASRVLCEHFARIGAQVRIVKLPLDREKHPKGDINDWVGQEGAGPNDFKLVMEQSSAWVPLDAEAAPTELLAVELRDATDPSNVGKRLQMTAIVSALETTPYLVPSKLKVACTRDQPGCSTCPVSLLEEDPDTGFCTLSVAPTSPAILELINSPRGSQRNALMSALRIPMCKVVQFSPDTWHVCRECRVTPQLNMRSEGSNNVVQPAIVVGDAVDLNVPYEMRGQLHSHPKTHQATLVIDDVDETQDSLESFAPTDTQLKELESFQPSDWSDASLETRLDEVYTDLEHNVTRIFGRRALHMLVDLTFHSLLMLPLGGREVNGWLNTLIVGDSAQGKTETTVRLIEHFGLGERMDCKNASVSGLLGGLQQMGTRWFVSWGVIPTHDRRLVVLEEVKGAPIDVIARLTDMRSSGIAEIPKIERRRAAARTRLIFISNPRSGRLVSAFNFGVESLLELIGGPEDVRRFDAATVLSSRSMGVASIRQEEMRRVPFKLPSELCRRLVMWAWTRSVDDVVIEDETAELTRTLADELGSEYVDTIPLFDKGTGVHKIARIAGAMAARTFSTDDSHTKVIVRPAHARAAAKLLRTLYDDPVMGYAEFSRTHQSAGSIRDPAGVKRHLINTRNPRTLVEQLLGMSRIVPQDLQDLCELDRDGAQRMMSMLVIARCLQRDGREYVKTSSFIELLREMRADDDMPAHVDTNPFSREEKF